MSLRRAQRAVRNMGGFAGGTSRLARPPSVLPEPDIRPGGDFAIAFVKFAGVMFADTFSEAVVTEEGAVNVYRNGLGGVTGFQPICGESRFSSFLVPGTAAGSAMYVPDANQPYVEWPYFYGRRESPSRTIWTVDLTTGALAQETASPGSGTLQYHAITSRPEVDYADALRGVTSTTAEQREWTKTDTPPKNTGLLAALPSPYEFTHFHLDADENYWLGGVDGWVVKTDPLGATIWSTQLPGDSGGSGTAFLAGLWTVDGVGGIAFLEQADAEHDFFLIDSADGSYTNVTSVVSIDGVAWDTVALGAFGAPNVITTQHGTRIGFGEGGAYHIADLS